MTVEHRKIEAGMAAMADINAAVKAFRDRQRLVLTAARGLLAARRQFPNNRDFGRWIQRSPYARLSKNDRASLISIGLHEKAVKPFLEMTGMASPTLLWRTVRLKACGLASKSSTTTEERKRP